MDEDLQVSDSRKHQLDLDIDQSIQQAILDDRGRPKRQRTTDISVLEDGGDSGSNDGDDSGDDSGDEYIDPSLQSTTSRQPLRSPPATFAHNTGNFLALATGEATIDAIQGSRASSNPIDYTHINQALAHQPLATNESQQTVTLMQKLATAGTNGVSVEDRLSAFMREVQNQMYALSQRVDVVETARFAAAQNISNLQTSFTALQSLLAPVSAPTADSNTSLMVPQTHSNPVSDATNNQSAEAMGAHIRRQMNELIKTHGPDATGDNVFGPDFINSLALAGTFNIPTGLALEPDVPVAGPSYKPQPIAPPRRRPKIIKRSGGAGGDVKTAPRKRKPELSRAVRATMFKLLNLPLANGTAKYHGYTSSPELPDFSETPIFDTTTGVRSWRWEWDKTIRQSQANAAFSTAIQNQVLAEREAELITDVPEADWAGLEDAVEAAYTNLRRERESQVNPAKKIKKDEHRKRGKKRGLKEEKRVRRVAAYSDGTQGGGSAMVHHDGVGQTWASLLSTFTSEGDDLGQALDIHYMSSEEEVDTNDPVVLSTPVQDIDVLGSSSLQPGEKAFYVHRPAWRSEKLQKAYAELDALKPAEKAYRRVLGSARGDYPPEGTPAWMISEAWQQDLIQKGGVMRHQRSVKGKAKQLEI